MTEIIKLKSGLRLAFEHMSSTGAVAMGVFVGAGSARENAATNGISHFIEHMLFKGTERRTAFQMAQEMDGIGAKTNAFTSRESTCYYALSIPEHADECMDCLGDMYFHSTFEDSCMEKEKGVVIEEINMCEDDPSDICDDLIMKSSFGNKGIGLGILGPKKNIKKFTKEDIKAYMDKYYVASNTVVSIAGNIDKETALSLVDKYFEREFALKERKKVPKYKAPVPQNNALVRRKKCEQANISYAFPMVGLKDPDYLKVVAFSSALGGNMSSRLFQKVREEKGLVYDVSAMPYAFSEGGAFIVDFATAPGNVEEAVKVIAEVLNGVVEEGFTEKEISTCREQLKMSTVLGAESASSYMRAMGRNALLGLKFDVNERLAEIGKMNVENINKAMRDVIKMDRLSSAYVGKDCKVDIHKLIKGEGK